MHSPINSHSRLFFKEESLKEADTSALKMPFSTTNKSFNFQILDRTLFTASKVYKCDISETDKCIK